MIIKCNFKFLIFCTYDFNMIRFIWRRGNLHFLYTTKISSIMMNLLAISMIISMFFIRWSNAAACVFHYSSLVVCPSLFIQYYTYRTLLYLLWPLDFQITKKCLPPVLELKYLEDLVLEGCSSVDDDSLSVLKQGCKSLQVLIIRELIALWFHFVIREKKSLELKEKANIDASSIPFF